MKHNYSATYKNVILRPLKEEDIEMLRIWRNDISQTKFLTPIGEISPAMQKKWYNDYLNNPDEITFSIIETASLNRLVGSVALYHFKNGIAEIGKIQIGDREAHGLGLGFVKFFV